MKVVLSHNNSPFDFSLEPVNLVGEGEYNLNVLKEIRVTDSYLGLDPSIKGCQNVETLENCTTRYYIDNLISHCVPFNMGQMARVLLIIVVMYSLAPCFQGPTCQPSQLDCVSKVVVDDTECPKSCSGILITGYSHFGPQEYSNHVTAFLSKLSVAYGKYKGMHDFHKNFQGRIFYNSSIRRSIREYFFL